MQEETFRWVITGAVAIATLSIAAMAALMFVLFKVVSKMQSKLEDVTGRVAPLMDRIGPVIDRIGPVIDRIGPVIDRVRRMADENAPQVAGIAANLRSVTTHAVSVSANVKDMSEMAREQAVRFGDVGRDIAERTKAQAAKVDAAIDETVIQVQNAGENMKYTALKPVREASAVVAGMRAAVSTFVAGQRAPINHIAQDEEMFI